MVAGVKWNIRWSGAGEVGQFGFHTGTGGVGSQEDIQAAADDVAAKINAMPAWWAAFTALISTDQRYVGVDAYWYEALNAPVAGIGKGVITSGAGSGGSNVLNPLQNSMCVSTLTGAPGASRRGRIYLPACGLAMSVGHQFTQAQIDAALTGLAGTGAPNTPDNLFSVACNALAAQGDSEPSPIVYSRTHNTVASITAVRADSVVDTQRRRVESQSPTTTRQRPFVFSS